MSRPETLVTVPQTVELLGITVVIAVAGHPGTRLQVGRQEAVPPIETPSALGLTIPPSPLVVNSPTDQVN